MQVQEIKFINSREQPVVFKTKLNSQNQPILPKSDQTLNM